MSSHNGSECCWLMTILRRRGRAPASSSLHPTEDSLILPYPRAGPNARRAGHRPRCCLVTKATGSSCATAACGSPTVEAIELKCYSLSKHRLVVSTDTKCCLHAPPGAQTRTRPLGCLEDGRRHLDVRKRPDSVSVIKLRIDPESGQLERRLSIHEIEDDNEFEDCKQGGGGGGGGFTSLSAPDPSRPQANELSSNVTAPERGEASLLFSDYNNCNTEEHPNEEERKRVLAAKLSRRSFFLVERSVKNCNVPRSIRDGGDPMKHDADEAGLCNLHPHDQVVHDAPNEHLEESLEQKFADSLSVVEEPAPGEDGLDPPTSCQVLEQQVMVARESTDRTNDTHTSRATTNTTTTPDNKHTRPATPTTTKRPKPRRLVKSILRFLAYASTNTPTGESPKNSTSQRAKNEHSPPLIEPDDDDDDWMGKETDQSDNNKNHNNESRNVVALKRPESIFLWPQRLSDCYHPIGGRSSGLQRHKRRASVMISYNHVEARQYAIALHAELETQGVSAYLDLYDIQKGEDWQDSLNFAILDCRLFVPLVTPSYGETLWTSRECKLADVLAKTIVPINFAQHWPPPSLAIQFATLQYVDWLHHELTSVLDPHMDGGGAGWPRECVQAIARQLKRRLQSDNNLLLRSSSSSSSAAAAVAPCNNCSSCESGGRYPTRDVLLSTSGCGGDSPPPLPVVPTRKRPVDTPSPPRNKQPRPLRVAARDRGGTGHLEAMVTAAPTCLQHLHETASTSTSSCHTSSSSPSCYESQRSSSSAACSRGDASPTLLDELSASGNFVLVPPQIAMHHKHHHNHHHHHQAQTINSLPASETPSLTSKRKRSLGHRTKNVFVRLKSGITLARIRNRGGGGGG